MHVSTVNRALAVASLAAIAGTFLVGCTPPGSDSTAPTAHTGVQLSPDEVRDAGEITLEIADYEATVGPSEALDKNIAQFETEYPNITINRTAKGFADYAKTVNLQMTSNNPPDIAELNIITNPALISSGALLPLDDYYEAYGWEAQQNYPTTALGILKAEPDASSFGTGNFYALGAAGNMIGVYYNKAVLERLGLDAPTTFDDFEAALETARQQNVTPIQLGNLDQIPAAFAIATVLTQFEDPDVLAGWVYGAKGSTFATPGIEAGVAKLGEWAEKGYFLSQANGTKDDDAIGAFLAGEGLFAFSGTWRLSQIDEALGADGGFMLLPPTTAGADRYASGAVQAPFTISSQSEHPDIAAFFLNYLIGPDTAENNLAGGWLPFGTQIPESTGGVTAQEAMAAWGDALATGVLTPSLDWATPTMGPDAEFPGLQSLIGGQMTATELVADMQANWAAYHG